MLLDFYRDFTAQLADRFKSRLNISPRKFLNGEVQLVADVEKDVEVPFVLRYTSFDNNASSNDTVPLFTVRGSTTPAIAFLDDITSFKLEHLSVNLYSGTSATATVATTIFFESSVYSGFQFNSTRLKALTNTATAAAQFVSLYDETPAVIRIGPIKNIGTSGTVIDERYTGPNINLRFDYNWNAASDVDRYFTAVIRGTYTRRYPSLQ